MEKHASIPFDLARTSCFSTLASSCKDAKKNRPTHYETSSRPSDAAPNTARPVSACHHCDTSDTESLLLLVVSYASDPRLSSFSCLTLKKRSTPILRFHLSARKALGTPQNPSGGGSIVTNHSLYFFRQMHCNVPSSDCASLRHFIWIWGQVMAR